MSAASGGLLRRLAHLARLHRMRQAAAEGSERLRAAAAVQHSASRFRSSATARALRDRYFEEKS